MRRDDTNFHMLDTTARVKHFKDDKVGGFWRTNACCIHAQTGPALKMQSGLSGTYLRAGMLTTACPERRVRFDRCVMGNGM